MAVVPNRPLLLPLWLALGMLLGGAPALAQPAAPAGAQRPASGAGSTDPVFDILEFAVHGNTVLDAGTIERVLYPFTGPGRRFADVQAARLALEKAYQDAGYLSVSVALPQQSVSQGLLRLDVLEGRVESLRITGAQHTLPSRLKAAVPNLRPGTVPNLPEMQQELSAWGRARPDAEITPLLAAGNAPGALAVELKLQDQAPVHGSLSLNNKQAANTEAGRLEADVHHDNLFQSGHSLGASWIYSPRRPAQSNILSLNYGLPLGGPGDRLSLSLTRNESNTPTPLGGSTFSRGSTLRAQWRDELAELSGRQQALTWTAVWRHLRNANRNVAGADTAQPDLIFPSFGAGYELNLTGTPRPGESARSTRVELGLRFSLASLSNRMVDCDGVRLNQFECKRAYATPGYAILDLSLEHTEPVGRWRLVSSLNAQLTHQSLVPDEQMTLGGVDSVRGYHDGEHAGDQGLSLRLEQVSPAWQPLAGLALRGLAFQDLGYVMRNDVLAEESSSQGLSSIGLGLRAETVWNLKASLYLARVMHSGSTARGQRVEFNLRHSF